MLEESRMEKKSLNRTSQPQSRASAIDCKKNTESTPRPWPRNNKKREGPGSTPKNEPNRKNAPPQYGRGQYDRRSRTRGSAGYHVGGTQNTRLGRDEEPEIGSVFVPGSKKQNMNHLLNFTYPSRGLPEHRGHQVRRPGFQNRGPSRHGHDHYLRAYCQFVIKEDGDIKANLLDPDIPLKWDHIEEVVVRATGRSKCLICLGPPAAGRVYRCGHIYCWACILHYAATHDKQPPPCPMCSTPLHVDDMKPIRIVEWEPETEEVTMRLVRRLRGSTAVEMAPPRGQVIEAMPPILPLENINKAPYTKMFSATKQQIHEILIRERHEIENQILAEIDTTEIVYLEQALEMLKSKEENINLRFSEPKLTINEETEAVVPTVYEKLEEKQNKLDWFDVNEEGAAACAEIMQERTCDAGMGDTNEKDRASPKNLELLDENEAGAACVDIIHNNMGALNLNTVDSNLNPEAPSFDIDEMQPEEFPLTECIVQETKQLEDNATTAIDKLNLKKFFYFYQAEDGQQIFLHHLNVRILIASWGALAAAPQIIRGRVLHRETFSLTEQERQHMPCTAHLPLFCAYDIVELELQPPYVTESGLNQYAVELKRRAQARARRKREEKLANRRAAENQQRPDLSSFPPYSSSPPYSSPSHNSNPPLIPSLEEPSTSVGSPPSGVSYSQMAGNSGTWRQRKAPAAPPPPPAAPAVDEVSAPRMPMLSDFVFANRGPSKKNKKSKRNH